MKEGFTILELLVASLLLGMLMTVLTMIFNQSSISWRVGTASVADLDTATENISTVRRDADNLYAWGSQSYALLSVWDSSDPAGHTLRSRAINSGISVSKQDEISQLLKDKDVPGKDRPGDWNEVGVGNEKTYGDANNYTVNVMSAGPNKQFNDYDDIWSFPNEFQ